MAARFEPHHLARRGRPSLVGRLGAAFVVLGALGLVASCDLVAGVDDLVANPPCDNDGECGTPPICNEFRCDNGDCVLHALPEGEPCGDGYRQCDANGRCLCPPVGCPNGATCEHGSECESGNCAEGECMDSPCGGACPGICWQCSQSTNTCVALPSGDTAGGLCPDGCDGVGNCTSCSNGYRDGSETDDDCGGSSCPPCADGLACDLPSDCQSCICTETECQPPACGSGKKEGCESDVDCGGPCGSTCAPGEQCKSKQDCASHSCVDGTCE